MIRDRHGAGPAVVALALAVLVAFVFAGVGSHEFLNYDDGTYITENAHVRQGLSGASARWALSAFHASNWHPLTWLSHMFDVQFFGLHPGRHHVVNVIFHLLSALVLFLVLYRMTGALTRSALVAALFAVHPLQVESVAWVAQRKSVLSTFLWMLTLLAYHGYSRRGGASRYATVLLLLAAGLMSKPMLVTLPFVLLLLDYWPLKRPREGLVREKIPLLALSAASCAVTYLAQQRGGAVVPLEYYSMPVRVMNALAAYGSYLGKMIWPFPLSVHYPHPGETLGIGKPAAASLLLLAVSLFVLRERGRRPYLAVGWLWFLGTLVPTIGLVQVGTQAMADRYAYVPMIGLAIMAVWGADDVLRKTPWSRALPIAVTVVVMAGLTLGARVQAGYWKDSETLFRRALAATSSNQLAHTNLGVALAGKGKFNEAIPHFRQALRILRTGKGAMGDLARAHLNLGVTLTELGRHDEAEVHLVRALELNPHAAEAHNSLGLAAEMRGELDGAVRHLRQAVAFRPDYHEAHNNLGIALARKGEYDEAVRHFTEALRLSPGEKAIMNNLARTRRLAAGEPEREGTPP